MTVRTAFDTARAAGRGTLVGYLPAGFPDVEGSIEALQVMVDSGCDVIEVGLPYSDPVMDGPTIQAAAQQALEGGVRTRDVLRTVEAVAATGTPTVVMTYWNPVDRYGVARFAQDLASAGGAGLITPDLTPDSAQEWIGAADAHDLDKIFLVAPSSTDARIAMTIAACRGFVYATAVMGVTGTRDTTSDLASPLVARTRAAAWRRTSRWRSVSGSATATRPPRSRRTPMASSSARRSSGHCSTTPATGVPAWPPSRRSPRTWRVECGVRRAWLGALLLAGVLTGCSNGEPEVGDFNGAVLDQPYTVPDADLTDTGGEPYSLAADTDKPLTLVFFGYTHCPDICQTVMANVAAGLTRLDEAEREQVEVVFVTTDPARDDEQALRTYLDRFDPTFLGLTGDLATITGWATPWAWRSRRGRSCRAAATRSPTAPR